MKAIMISIKPKWVAKILNGEKTLEICKSFPKCDLPIDVYIYCTKSNYFGYISKRYIGKVVAKFTLNKVEEISHKHNYVGNELKTFFFTDEIQAPSEFERLSCLTKEEIYNYCLYGGYAWHIDNLEIFDKPKELSEFKVKRKINECSGCKYLDTNTYEHCIKCEETKPLTKAPQSWCYVEVELK